MEYRNLGRTGITSTIVGPRTLEQLLDNLGTVGVTIPDADLQRIDVVSPPGRMIVHYHRADTYPRERWL